MTFYSVEESRVLLRNTFFLPLFFVSHPFPPPHSAVHSISDTTAMSNEWFCLALVLNKWVDCIQCVVCIGLISVVLAHPGKAQKHPTQWLLLHCCRSRVCSQLCLLVGEVEEWKRSSTWTYVCPLATRCMGQAADRSWSDHILSKSPWYLFMAVSFKESFALWKNIFLFFFHDFNIHTLPPSVI